MVDSNGVPGGKLLVTRGTELNQPFCREESNPGISSCTIKEIGHREENLLIKKTAGQNLPAVMRRIEEEKS